MREKETNGRKLEANLNWCETWAKIWQLIASLAVILSKLNLPKLSELGYLSLLLCAKKKVVNTAKNFCITQLLFVSSSAQVCKTLVVSD